MSLTTVLAGDHYLTRIQLQRVDAAARL